MIPDIPGSNYGIDSDGFFDLEHQPKRVAVIGTGYIGVELAGIFNTLGTQTTIFSRTKQILRSFDSIIKDNLLKEMQSVGVNFAFDSKVNALVRESENGPITIQYEADGKSETLEVDCVVWAVGRVPNIKKLNLASANVEINEKGYIIADAYQKTTQDNVFALGDACGVAELTPGKKKKRERNDIFNTKTKILTFFFN